MKFLKQIHIVLFFLSALSVSAQVKFEAQTERSSYGLNERIQLVFSINNEGDNFVAPKFPGFKAEGPFINKGNQTSITIINGRVNQKREISTQVIYYLTPTKKGTFTIGAASIEYDGTVYKSAPIKITITDPIQMPTYPGQQPTNVNYGEGIHLVAELSTKNPFVNEPVTVVYKLYFEPRSTVGNFRNFKAPKYNDFWSQYIDMKQLRAERGKYNGKDYSMVVLRKVILYPLEAGAKTIEPFKIDLERLQAILKVGSAGVKLAISEKQNLARIVKENDLAQIAKIHKQQFADHYLGNFSEKLLLHFKKCSFK